MQQRNRHDSIGDQETEDIEHGGPERQETKGDT
jgi:hypothetical protein